MAETALHTTIDDLDGAVHTLLCRIGARLKARRTGLGMSRRALSELSGVSVRYLAQMETGTGNMSVGLLMRVALALDCPIEWLLSADDDATTVRHGRICLVGLRGAGKSTLGRLVASDFGMIESLKNVQIVHSDFSPCDRYDNRKTFKTSGNLDFVCRDLI